jgi:hypothetical protein
VAGQTEQLIALALPPQVTPLEAAQIRLARIGNVLSQEIECLPEVVRRQRLLREVDVGGI